MVEIHDIDENASWRNDPLAKRAVMAAREWNVHHRKGKEAIRPQQMAVMDYGRVLLEIKSQHVSNKKYNEDVLARRLNIPPFDDRRYRSAALTIAKAIDYSGEVIDYGVVNTLKAARRDYSVVNTYENAFDNCDTGNAQHMATWARNTGLIPRKPKNTGAHLKARNRVRASVENGETLNREQIADELDVSQGTVQRAALMEQARLEGVTEGEAAVLNAQGKFTKAQAKHVEALIKKLQRDLDAQFVVAVEKQVTKLVAAQKAALKNAREAVSKQLNDAFKDQQHWKALINNHKPLFTEAEYRTIVMALHPDNSASEETRARALQSFNEKKLQLT